MGFYVLYSILILMLLYCGGSCKGHAVPPGMVQAAQLGYTVIWCWVDVIFYCHCGLDFYVLYSILIHMLPLRFHYFGGGWNGTLGLLRLNYWQVKRSNYSARSHHKSAGFPLLITFVFNHMSSRNFQHAVEVGQCSSHPMPSLWVRKSSHSRHLHPLIRK